METSSGPDATYPAMGKTLDIPLSRPVGRSPVRSQSPWSSHPMYSQQTATKVDHKKEAMQGYHIALACAMCLVTVQSTTTLEG